MPPAVEIYRRRSVPWQQLGDAVLVLGTETSEVHELNASATSVWTELAEPRSVAELATQLAGEYLVDADEAARDVEALLEAWLAKRLVERIEA